MIFDGHGDIWTHVAIKRSKGAKNIIKNYHLDRFKQGNLIGGIFIIWVDPPYDNKPKERALDIIGHMASEIMENQDIIKIIYNHKDFNLAIDENKLAVLIGMEGLDAIGERVDLLNTLYLLGLRHASLTWNEENLLATGVDGNPERGLTSLGIDAVNLMEHLGIIVDVSHANEKSFWDIYENTNKPFIASHSNCKSLCDVPRNITDAQLKAIAERNGLVGLNAFGQFIHKDESKQDLEHLVNHLDHMVEIMGIDHVGFGFDFFDYLNSDTVGSFAEGDSYGTIGFEDVSKTKNLLDLLSKRGYSKDDIEKISYKNFYRIIKETLI